MAESIPVIPEFKELTATDPGSPWMSKNRFRFRIGPEKSAAPVGAPLETLGLSGILAEGRTDFGDAGHAWM